jgi:FKBP-type peptidyl-prolyl cis-trans isomerase FklB
VSLGSLKHFLFLGFIKKLDISILKLGENMNTTKEKASYCIGLETGKNLKQQFVDIDHPSLIKGFQDAIANTAPQLKQEEIQSILTSLKQQIELQEREFIAHVAEQNKKISEKFLAENKTKENIITMPSGLQYRVLASGNGPSPKSIDNVTIHFKGSTMEGHIFENTYEQGKPRSIPVNRVIAGWSEALQLMKVGDKWQLFIPSYLAYGEMGLNGQLGPNIALIFEMELIGIN